MTSENNINEVLRGCQPLEINQYIYNVNIAYEVIVKSFNDFSLLKHKSIIETSKNITEALDLFIESSRILRKKFSKMGVDKLRKANKLIEMSHFLTKHEDVLKKLYVLRNHIDRQMVDGAYETQFTNGMEIIVSYIKTFEILKESTSKWAEKLLLGY